MPNFQFFGSSLESEHSAHANTSRLLNFYREPVEGGFVLRPVLGMLDYTNIPGVICKAAETIEGSPYVVQGTGLYRITENGGIEALGTVANDTEVSISGNNGAVTVVAGGRYYVRDNGAISTPSGAAFSDFGSVTFSGQRTILTERNGRRVQWSGVADPTSLDGLDFATTEARDDNNIRALAVNGQVWFFKEESIEVWAHTATGLQALPGAVIDTGLKGFNLAVKIPNGVFFIGSDNKAYLGAGTSITPVSTPPVQTSITHQRPTRVSYFQDEGYEFCCIHFRDRPSWIINTTTLELSERAQGAHFGRWDADVMFKAYGSYYAVNAVGAVSRLARVGLDGSEPLRCRALARTIDFGLNGKRISDLRIRARVGDAAKDFTPLESVDVDGMLPPAGGIAGFSGSDDARRVPFVELRMSGDRGHTWGPSRRHSLGVLGGHGEEIESPAWGWFRNATLRLDYADTFDVTFNAFADVATA